ncbi:hypothetical protein FA95DRAFT_1558818 [Auriscalpium vulgare]|uniref:Uncharacterized protein n=1 Tax=Auriscalpium vulgare TaxID=40419 RepID=A0ACB8RUZ1_9AGAM|nr:hypothetical protein FA95DRAFT_1558818 [Auriscalpium vulgare]
MALDSEAVNKDSMPSERVFEHRLRSPSAHPLFAVPFFAARFIMANDDFSSHTFAVANNLRVTSLAIALYDYLYTLPSEWRFYKSQAHSFRLSTGFVLFVLIRYISILILVVSNVGFFSHSFTAQSCQHYYLAAPVLKVLQTMVSQAIVGVRTYNISRRNRWVGWAVLSGYFVAIVIQWFSNLWHRTPVAANGHCTPGSLDPDAKVAAWVFYLVAMLYDMMTLSISTYFLIMCRPNSTGMSHLMKVMLYDGLGYFVALTGANVLNLILYRASNTTIQSAGASLGYAVSWIMSQRILIHLREASIDAPRAVVSQYLQTSRDINDALRGATHKVSRLDREEIVGERDVTEEANELDVCVRVEHSVVVDYNKPSFTTRGSTEREIYSAPKVMWDQGLPDKP